MDVRLLLLQVLRYTKATLIRKLITISLLEEGQLGDVHDNPSRNSMTFLTIACGSPVNIKNFLRQIRLNFDGTAY